MKGAVLLALLFVGVAHGQLSTQGEVGVAVGSSFVEGVRADPSWTLAGHLEARYVLSAPLETTFTLVLDPSVRVGREVTFGGGLTEAYALVRRGEVDVSAGVERLPLETARLSVPFSVETRGARGLPEGVLGVRAAWYPDLLSASWRVRGALLYTHRDTLAQDTLMWDTLTWNALTPLVSVRGSFEGIDLEATALYTQALGVGSFITGLGGSALVGDTILYGEAWVLTNPTEARGALGASGYLGERLWTLEAAYAALPPSTAPAPQLAGQLTLLHDEVGEVRALTGTARLLFAGAPEVQPALTYSAISGDEELVLSAGGSWNEGGRALNVSVGVRRFF
jgi:hypothetical protein